MSPLKTLIIADLNLITYEGHNFEYDLNLKREAEKQGVKCPVWGNMDVARRVIDRISATPCFHLTYGVPLPGHPVIKISSDVFYSLRWPRLYQFARHLIAGATFRGHHRSLYNDLRQASKTATMDSDTFVLFHTIQAPQIEPICRWHASFPVAERPHLGLLFRFEPDCEMDHPVRSPRWTRRAYDLLRSARSRGKLHLLTDSQTLSRRFEVLTGCPVSVVPIPQRAPDVLSAHDAASNRSIRFGYLGNARDNKGFSHLPALVRASDKGIQAGNIKFIIQLCRSSGDEPASQTAFDALQKLPVTPVLGELDSEGYYNLLGQMDVVLLPYDPVYYKSQTSGIFSDALAFGKIVVVPKNTWMADQLHDHGAGIVYDSDRPNGLSSAVGEILDHYEELQARASDRVQAWLLEHSAGRYLEKIVKCMTDGTNNPGLE